jgi:CheY-like chemotaxis protein
MFSRPTILDLHHQHTILLVEDDPDARSAVAELLRLDGYQVLEAGDGQEALGALSTGRLPCLVLLDLNMPGTSGWRFRALQLRDRAIADIPVIALSGHGGLEQQARAMNLDGWLEKPLDFDKLLAIVGRTCRVAA